MLQCARIFYDSRSLSYGFTIIELSLVIVIIAILAAATTGSVLGFYTNANDRQRTSDITTIASALERYYRTQAAVVGAGYPGASVGASGIASIVGDNDALTAPDQSTTSLIVATSAGAQSPTYSQYIYQPMNADGSICNTTPCAKFKLYFRTEANNTVKSYDSLRQQ